MRAALLAALDDDVDQYVRSFAAWALGTLKVEEAIPILQARLKAAARKSLEEASVGLALARLHTAPAPEAVQESLFPEDTLPIPQAPESLPRTKSEILQADLQEVTERVSADRAGNLILVRGGLRTWMQLARNMALKERVIAERGPGCQLCDFTFRKKSSGEPYAECHHVVSLCDGGPDEPDNLLVLCANHHRQLHYADVRFPDGSSRPTTVWINGATVPVRWVRLK